jgi:hypothetical protein
MPRVSKETASDVREFGPVTDRREEMDGYTVEFVSFAADADLDGRLQSLPGDREEVYEAGDAFYTPLGHRPYVDAGTEVLQFSPTDGLAVLERALAEWMSAQG